MDTRIGIIGVGNMGEAIARGIQSGDFEPDELLLYDRYRDHESLRDLIDTPYTRVCEELEELERRANRLVLAVKPGVVRSVLESLVEPSEAVVGSIAAGVRLEELSEGLGGGGTVVRAMPNTPAQVGEGITFLATRDETPESVLDDYRYIFESVGSVHVIDESDMSAVTALTGSGPAYVMFFIEALEEAGLHLGLPEETVEASVRDLLRGSLTLLEEGDRDPAEVRRAVSSPGGTTVEALKHLRERGWDGTLMEAVRRAAEKADRLQ